MLCPECCGPPAVPDRAPTSPGSYRIGPAGAEHRLELFQNDTEVLGELLFADGADGVFEGTVRTDDRMALPASRASSWPPGFSMALSLRRLDGGDHQVSLTPLDPAGGRLEAQTLVYSARYSESDPIMPAEPRRAEGASNPSEDVTGPEVPEADPPGSAGQLRPDLVGVWSTQVVMNTPSGGMATQLFMELTADGWMRELGSRSVASAPGAGLDSGLEGGGDAGRVRAEGDVLYASYGGSPFLPFARYELNGDRLLLTYLQDGE